MIKVTRVNGKQRQWLIEYERSTGFDPLYLEDLEQGTMSFNEIAKRNVNWFESWMNEAFHAISDPPYTQEN